MVLHESSEEITKTKPHTKSMLVTSIVQTHISSKFLLIDSGIFGLVTRTAFIGNSKKEGNSEGKLLITIRRHRKQIDWSTSIYSDFDSSPQTGEQMSFIFFIFSFLFFYLLCVWVWGEGVVCLGDTLTSVSS